MPNCAADLVELEAKHQKQEKEIAKLQKELAKIDKT